MTTRAGRCGAELVFPLDRQGVGAVQALRTLRSISWFTAASGPTLVVTRRHSADWPL